MEHVMAAFFGLIGVTGGIFVTGYGERLGVETWRDTQVIQAEAIPVDPNQPPGALDSKLVLISGVPETEATLTLPHTELTTQGALRFKQVVEMYQWVERRRTDEGITHYYYDLRWATDRVPSERFHRPRAHENPPLPWRSEDVSAERARVGAYLLTAAAIDKMNWFETMDICRDIWTPTGSFKCEGEFLYFGSGSLPRPHLGDVRIRFLVITPSEMTLIGEQQGGSDKPVLRPHALPDGDTLLEVRRGRHSIADMVTLRQDQDWLLHQVLLGVGTLLSGGGAAALGYGGTGLIGLSLGPVSFAGVLRLATTLGIPIATASAGNQWYGYDDTYANILMGGAGFLAVAAFLILF